MATLVRTGRPRASWVWEYFHYDPQLNRSECLVVRNGKACGMMLKGKFPSNLRSHLKSNHRIAYNVMEEKQMEKLIKGKDVRRQQALASLPRNVQEQEKENAKHLKITEKLVRFVATSGCPCSIVENEEFRALMEELDPSYVVPCSSRLGEEVDRLVSTIKCNVSTKLMQARQVHLCVDRWFEKGISAFITVVTGHFLAELEIHHITLAVRCTPCQHTTSNTVYSMVSNTLQEWHIDPAKIGKVLTNTISSMSNAFKEIQHLIQHPEQEQVNSHEIISSECQCTESQLTANTFDRAEGCADRHGNSTEELDTSDYELKETDSNMAFSRSFHQMSCFTQTLQLVASQFESDKILQSLVQKTKIIVTKVNSIISSTETPIAIGAEKLAQEEPTRWCSTFLLVDRLLKVRTEISQVLEQLDWKSLQPEEWEQLQDVHSLLEPFAQYTNLCGSENYTTISSVIPIVMELTLHLREMQKKTSISSGASRLLQELHFQFDSLSDASHTNFTPLYLMATALDPRFCLLLTDREREMATQHILAALKQSEEVAEPGCSLSTKNTEIEQLCQDIKPSPLKRFKYLSELVGQQTTVQSPPQPSKAERELAGYFSRLQISNFENKGLDPLQFWQGSLNLYPTVAALALDVLSIPASSDSMERVLLVNGNSCRGKLNNFNLEQQVFVQNNSIGNFGY